MRFAGALSILAFTAGSTALGQSAEDRDQRIADLQKQLDALSAQLKELQGKSATSSAPLEERLDGAVRQSPAEALREPRRLNISAPGIDALDISGYMHVRGEAWGNYDNGGGNADGLTFATEVALGFDAKISEKSHVYIEPQATFAWGDNTSHDLGGPPGSSGGTGNFDDIEIVQAYLGVDDLYGSGWDLDVGRQKIELGAERMIGDDEWSFNRTTFDGFRADRNLGDPGNLTLLAIRTQDNNHFPATPLHPMNSPQDDHAELYSVYYGSNRNDQTGQFDLYVFHLEDGNYSDGVSGDRTRWTTYGGRWNSPNLAGFLLDVEAATQFGEYLGLKTGNHDWGFDVWALHAGVQYKLPADVQWFDGFFAGYDYATGGVNANGDIHSFVQLYPSVHGWFGITDYFSWTNIQHWVLGANFKAPEGLVSLAWHWNRMANNSGGFVGYNASGGASTDGKDLGMEADAVYSVNCTKTTFVDFGLAYFMAGDAYASAGGGGDNNQVFGYMQFRTHF